MKKIIYLSLPFLLTIFLTTACSFKKIDDTDVNNEKKNETKEIEMFNGNITAFWTDVEDEYDEIEQEAKIEVDNMDQITKEDIKNIEKTIETNYQKVKNGITKENEENAKELYKAASKIQEISKRKNVDHELVTLSDNAKSLVRHYYGEGDKDYSDVKKRFEKGLNNIKNYTEDKWQEFVNLIK